MLNFVGMFQCNARYNAVHNVFTQILQCRNCTFALTTLSVNNKKTSKSGAMFLHVAQVK